MPAGDGLFACRRILFVADEFFLADDLRQILHEHHAEIFGPAATITDIRRLEKPLDRSTPVSALKSGLDRFLPEPVAWRLQASGTEFSRACWIAGVRESKRRTP